MNYVHELFEIETTTLVLVKFIADFNHSCIHYDGKCYGPYEKGELVELPLWIAEQANKSHSVKYLPPRWLRLPYLKNALNSEKDTEVLSSYFSENISSIVNKLQGSTGAATTATRTNNAMPPMAPQQRLQESTLNINRMSMSLSSIFNNNTNINNTLAGQQQQMALMSNQSATSDLHSSDLINDFATKTFATPLGDSVYAPQSNETGAMLEFALSKLPMETPLNYQKVVVGDWWIILTKRLLKYFAEYETRAGIIFTKGDMRDTSKKNSSKMKEVYADDDKVVLDSSGLINMNDLLRQIENIRSIKLKKMLLTPPGIGAAEERDNMFKIATGMTKQESSQYIESVRDFWRQQFNAFEASKEIDLLYAQ